MYSKKIKSLLEELFTCPICLDILKNPATTKCGHSFCIDCVKMNKYECAVCRTRIESNFSINFMIKKAIESLQNMSEEEFESKFSQKNSTAIENNSILKSKRNEDKILQTEVKPKRISGWRENHSNHFDRENYYAKSENVNKYRIKRLRSQIDCFNEIDRNYLHNEFNFLNNQTQNLECNRNLFNNNDNNNYSNYSYNNNEFEFKFLFPDMQNQPVNKLTSRIIDNYLDEVLIKFQNGNFRSYTERGSSRNSNNSRLEESSMNFYNEQNINTPIQNNLNNVNINIYNIHPGQANVSINFNNIHSQTSTNISNQLNFDSLDVVGKRFKFK